jgi:hypothetical protein
MGIRRFGGLIPFLYHPTNEMQIESAGERLEKIMQVSVEADLPKTLGVGPILSMVLMLEIGKVERFPTAGAA